MHKLTEYGKCEHKTPLGKEDNKMQLKEIGSGVMDKTRLTQNRGTWRTAVNTSVNLCIP